MPITDKTSWQLSRQGALQSFENEALLLPTPSAKRVVEKRIQFVLSKMKTEQRKERETYFFGRGIRVDFSDLIKFVTALQEVFLNSGKTSYWIGSLANHDIRRVLEVSRDVINSPHLGFDEAFKAYIVGSAIFIRPFKIRKALIRGRYDIYLSDFHKYLHNVFDLNAEIQTSPLLGLRILQTLKDAVIKRGETRSKYISKADLAGYLCGLGIERRAICLWLDALLKRALVLNYDPTCTDEATATQLEISPSGELHLLWGCGDYDYLFAMAETTPVRNEGAFIEMRRAYEENRGKDSNAVALAGFLRHVIAEDQIFVQVPDHESYRGQLGLVRKLQGAVTRFERG
jgi:hypothetical protein